jgi:phage terminase large subunit-like protein
VTTSTLDAVRVGHGCGWSTDGLWPSHGGVAVDWIHDNLIFAEGDYYGEPFRLRPDQQAFLWRWYEHCDRCGAWRYRRGLKGASKGDGKTAFIAAIACLEFAGPSCIAPKSPNIPIMAASFEQANLLFSVAGTMLGGKDKAVKEAPLREYFEVYDTEIRFADGRPGRMYRVAAQAGTNDGTLPTLFLADELHELGAIGSNKARVHTVIANGLRKRRSGRELNLSTAGAELDGSLLGAMYKHGLAVAHDPAVDPEFLFDWREAPDGLNYDDPADRRVAVRAASAAADVLWSVEDRVRRWDDPVVPHHEWIRYFANKWVAVTDDSWLVEHPGAWAACESDEPIPRRGEVVAGVDMSLRNDSTSVVIVHPAADGRMIVRSRVWDAPKGGVIDHLEVMAYIRRIADQYVLRECAYDPRFFEVPSLTLRDEGLNMVEVPQTPERMAPACSAALELIVQGKVAHDGDPVLTAHVSAAVKRENDRGWTLSKGRSKRKIDACIALIIALSRAQVAEQSVVTLW